MKINEIINESDTGKGSKSAKYKGLILKYAFNDRALLIKVYDPATKSPIGFVKFVKEDAELYPENLWVNDDYRSRGIAKAMYDYLKSEGYIINRSHDQTKAGSGFWDKHRGEDVRVWEEGYQPPELEVGDKILKGKFKNSPAEIKGFKKDKRGQPVLKTNKGDVQLFKPRIAKLDVNEDREYIRGGKYQINLNGVILSVSIDGQTVDVRALDPESKAELGYVVFDRDGDTLVADGLAVDEHSRGRGIAKTMYNHVKERGFTVKRSHDQTSDGKTFWDKNKGQEGNLWEQDRTVGSE